jgi:manganese efflux pump family protein
MVMRFVTLISWLVTAGIGAFMLRSWLARGGLRRERARAGGLPPQLIFGHAGLAITGLLVWTVYVATGAKAVAWTAVGVLMVVVGLGLSTVTLWTPYPARKPGERRAPTPWDEPVVVVPDTPAAAADPSEMEVPLHPSDSSDPLDSVITDEMIVQLLEDPFSNARPRAIRPNPEVLVPIAHGFAAIGTFVLAVMTASM